MRVDCARDCDSSDTVRRTGNVTDYTVDDADSSHCAHANSIVRATITTTTTSRQRFSSYNRT